MPWLLFFSADTLPYLFPYLLALALRRCIFWLSLHRDLLRSLLRFQNPSASDSPIRLHITANRSSSHSRGKPRHSTLHQSLCAVRNRYIMIHEYQGNFAVPASFVPSSLHLLTQAHPSSIDFASAHPDTRTKLRPHPTSTLTLTTSRRKKLPLPNARTKRQLVRALVDVQARAVGCLRAYLAMVDGTGPSRRRIGLRR